MQRGRPLRVGLTIGPPGPGGIGSYARELATALSRRADIELVTIGSATARDELGTDRGDHIVVRGGRSVEQASVVTLGPVVRRRDIDVVHSTRHVLPAGGRIARVLTFHDDYLFTRADDYDLAKRLVLPRLYRRSLSAADAVITLAPELVDVARRYTRRDTCVECAGAAIATGLAEAEPVAPLQELPARFALVVGDAGPRKRVGRLLDEWPAVAAATGIELVVAGGRAATPELRARLERPPAVFVPMPSDAELAYLYGRAELVVDAAAAEGYGFPQVEAATFGVPHVAIRTDEPVLGHVRAAIDAPPRPAVGRAAGGDTWDDVAERTVAIYRRVIEQSQR